MSTSDTPEGEAPLPDQPTLRYLRALVTVMTVVMCTGILGILGVMVHRYNNARAPLPERITLPSGTVATSFTQGAEWYAVVTADNQILIFDRESGALRQTLTIDME